MKNKDELFYESKRKSSNVWLFLCIVAFLLGGLFLWSYIQGALTDISNIVRAYTGSFVFFLIYLYISKKYVKMTEKELETVVFLKKKVYKLETLERYECKKLYVNVYYYFIIYFGDKVCIVSVLDREKFAKLLDTVIEKNNTNSNVSESDV